ncbi:MAG: GNAT family N-acetyltransferase [Bacilli bacterium]|nr:GNAT family N-acetyltransferase [Bacilli bacterium]
MNNIKCENINSEILLNLDNWLDNDKGDIEKYAMFDYSFTTYEHSLKVDVIEGETYVTKAFYIDDILMAYIAICLYKENDNNCAGINPIVVNPNYVGKGYGKMIIEYIKIHFEEIYQIKIDYLYALVDLNNKRSAQLFEACGFKKDGKAEANFQNYKYSF